MYYNLIVINIKSILIKQGETRDVKTSIHIYY
jgi:hypothetical protein